MPAYAMGAYSQMQIPMRTQEIKNPAASSASAVLYYSNYCSICNNLLRMIASRDLKSVFALVCVDEGDRRKVPEFVKSVPMAYISGRVTGGNPQLLSEGSLLEYIEKCARAAHKQPSQLTNQKPTDSELNAASHAGGGAYSFINDNDGKPGDGAPGRSSAGSFFYELNGNDVDFRIDAVESDAPVLPHASADKFTEPIETRRSSPGKELDVSSIEALRRADEDQWKPPKA